MPNGRISFLAAALALLAIAPVVAAPKTGVSWQLDMRFHDPQRIEIVHPGDTEPTVYWYLIYEVTNNTGRDRQFFPSFRLVTGTLQVVEGGANISPTIYNRVIARHRREFPFLAPPVKVTGLLLQGRENARASVAIFRDFDPNAARFTIYAAGLSGDFQRSPNPAFDRNEKESASNRRHFHHRRTLAIEYELPGDPAFRSRVKPIRRLRQWVMR